MGKCHLTKGKQALEIRSSLSEKRALTDPIQGTAYSAESLVRNLQWAKAHGTVQPIFVKSFYNKLLLNHEFFFLLNIQLSSQFCSENILAWANPRLKNVSIIDIRLIYLILDILFNPLFLPLVKLKYNHF